MTVWADTCEQKAPISFQYEFYAFLNSMFNVQIREANTNTSNAGTPISNELSVDSVLSTEQHAFWTDGQSLYENRKAYLYKYYKASTFFWRWIATSLKLY